MARSSVLILSKESLHGEESILGHVSKHSVATLFMRPKCIEIHDSHFSCVALVLSSTIG